MKWKKNHVPPPFIIKNNIIKSERKKINVQWAMVGIWFVFPRVNMKYKNMDYKIIKKKLSTILMCWNQKSFNNFRIKINFSLKMKIKVYIFHVTLL